MSTVESGIVAACCFRVRKACLDVVDIVRAFGRELLSPRFAGRLPGTSRCHCAVHRRFVGHPDCFAACRTIYALPRLAIRSSQQGVASRAIKLNGHEYNPETEGRLLTIPKIWPQGNDRPEALCRKPKFRCTTPPPHLRDNQLH